MSIDYFIKDYTTVKYPRIIRMSFEMSYHDWCKFEKSKTFRCLIKRLEKWQTTDISNKSITVQDYNG